MISLCPLKARRKSGANHVNIHSLFEIMLIMAIRERSDQLTLRNTHRGCRIIHSSGDSSFDVVPMPSHLAGRAVNYYRQMFGIQYPDTHGIDKLTLAGHSTVRAHFEMLGLLPIGLARFTFTDNQIPVEECDESMRRYFKTIRKNLPIPTRIVRAIIDRIFL